MSFICLGQNNARESLKTLNLWTVRCYHCKLFEKEQVSESKDCLLLENGVCNIGRLKLVRADINRDPMNIKLDWLLIPHLNAKVVAKKFGLSWNVLNSDFKHRWGASDLIYKLSIVLHIIFWIDEKKCFLNEIPISKSKEL